MAAREIARQFMVDLKSAALDEIARFALPAKAVGLELDQCCEGEGVVTRDEIDVAMADSCHAERTFPPIISRYVVNYRARIVPLGVIGHRACVAAHNEHRGMPS